MPTLPRGTSASIAPSTDILDLTVTSSHPCTRSGGPTIGSDQRSRQGAFAFAVVEAAEIGDAVLGHDDVDVGV